MVVVIVWSFQGKPKLNMMRNAAVIVVLAGATDAAKVCSRGILLL